MSNVADDHGGQYVDDGEHEEVPQPPDLEHYIWTKARVKHLQTNIDNKLVNDKRQRVKKGKDAVLRHIDWITSSPGDAVLGTVLPCRDGHVAVEET